GRMDHAMTLRAEQLDVFLRAALAARQTVVLRQLTALERPAAQAARKRRSVCCHEVAPFLSLRVAEGLVSEVGAEVVRLLPHLRVAGEEVDEIGRRDTQRLGRLTDASAEGVQDVEDDADRRPEA